MDDKARMPDQEPLPRRVAAASIHRFVPVLAALVCVAGGCAEEGPPRYHVSGTVTYEGKPVPAGSILFQPHPTEGNGGAYGSAVIEDGRFDTRLEGEPISGGPQIVIIEAFDGKAVHSDYAPYGQALGSGYQQRHDLPEADTTLEIELTKKPGERR